LDGSDVDGSDVDGSDVADVFVFVLCIILESSEKKSIDFCGGCDCVFNLEDNIKYELCILLK
jgi:hypothetical protein